jgi:hypothetical protein
VETTSACDVSRKRGGKPSLWNLRLEMFLSWRRKKISVGSKKRDFFLICSLYVLVGFLNAFSST